MSEFFMMSDSLVLEIAPAWIAVHSLSEMTMGTFSAPTARRALVSAIPLIFLSSALSMSGLARRPALTLASASNWACLSKGLFLRAAANFASREATSSLYALLAAGE